MSILSRYWNQLSFRFPILIVVFSVLAGLAVGAIALTVANNGLIDSVKENMRVLRNERTRAIGAEIETRKRLLETFAYTPTGVTSLAAFGKAFRALDEAGRGALIKAYTEDNRFPEQNRIALTDAGDASAYTAVHKTAHSPIAHLVQLNKLYDVLLVDLDGNIVYTARKESDFGTNLLRGPLKDGLAGKLFRKALANAAPPQVVMADLERYPPTGNQPTLMIARALEAASGEILGVAIFQIDINSEVLSAAANNTLNLGETGEVQLVGQDLLLRSDTRFAKGGALARKVDTYSPRQAIAGFDGVETTVDYRGHEVISAYGPLDIMGVRWGVIAKVDLAEVQAPLHRIAALILAGVLASIVIIGSIGYAVTRSVSRPLKGAIGIMDQLTAGNRNVDVTFEAHVDEIRAIGNGLRMFKDGLIKTDRLMEEVKRSQEQLAHLLDSSPTGVIVVSDANDLLFANDPAAYILGIDKTTFVGKKFSFAQIAASEADAARMIASARRHGAVNGAELAVRIPADAILNVSIRQTVYMAKDAYLIWFYDITEQKRLHGQREAALNEAKSERTRTAAILAGAPDPIIIVRADSTIEYVNDQITKVLGYSRDELIGEKIERLLPERFRAGHRAQVNGFFDTGSIRLMGAGRELFARAKDGNEVPVEIALSPIRVGEKPVVVALLRDITERKKAEAALQESQQLLSGVIQNSRTVIFVKRQGRYIMVNKAWEEMTGISAEDARNKTDLEVFDEPAARRIMENDAAVIASRRPTEYEEPVIAKGKTIHFLSLKFPFFNAAGEVDGLCGMSTDITERAAAEKAIREARDAAEAATKAKSDFLASMSHEIRTPMNGVTGMADLLAQSELTDDQRHMVRTIRESGNALITVINDILDFSKIEAGKMDFEELSMSVADALEGVASTLTPSAVKKGIRIGTFVDPAIPNTVRGDAVRVRQILFNLTGNAVKFSAKKDVALRASVSRTDGAGNLWVRFDIVDQGIGISEENQAKLFKAFSQAESSTTRRFGGTGLGLAICKRLTELMGGSISVKSRLNEGSTFTAEIPFKPSDSERSHEKQRDLTGLRVLLLGSPGARGETIGQYLRHWGAEVVAFADDREAAAALKKADEVGRGYSSVMLDLDFDAMRQNEAVTRLRNAAATAVPMIVLEDHQMRGARIKTPDVVTVDANPIIRYRILSAVAVAAGRASPQVKPDDTDFKPVTGTKAPSIEDAIARGQLILLAEDNVTNQDVIRRQLGLLGYTCEIAANGAEALRAHQTGRHVLLLTDCHMPEMDGYELTGRIRDLERGSGVRLPIIAVTANALQGEVERCLAAGMDDYVSKPIAMPVLAAALKKWMPPPQGAAAPAGEIIRVGTQKAAAKPPRSTDRIVIDERAIKDTFGDDAETFKEILESFVAPSQDIIGDMIASCESGSAQGVKDAAHKLKSSARTVGAHALADTCVALEAAGKAADWATIKTLTPTAREQFADVAAYVKEL